METMGLQRRNGVRSRSRACQTRGGASGSYSSRMFSNPRLIQEMMTEPAEGRRSQGRLAWVRRTPSMNNAKHNDLQSRYAEARGTNREAICSEPISVWGRFPCLPCEGARRRAVVRGRRRPDDRSMPILPGGTGTKLLKQERVLTGSADSCPARLPTGPI